MNVWNADPSLGTPLTPSVSSSGFTPTSESIRTTCPETHTKMDRDGRAYRLGWNPWETNGTRGLELVVRLP